MTHPREYMSEDFKSAFVGGDDLWDPEVVAMGGAGPCGVQVPMCHVATRLRAQESCT